MPQKIQFKPKSDFTSSIFPPNMMLILPNDLVLFQFIENLLNKNEVVLYPKVLTFGRLESELSEELGAPVVDTWSRQFFLNTLAPELWSILGMPGEPESARLAELSAELGDGLDRLRLSGLSWAEVSGLEPPLLARKIAELGHRLDKWLGEKDDIFSRRRHLLEALTKKRSFLALADLEVVYCQHSQRLSPFEVEFLKALSYNCRVELHLDVPQWLIDENETLISGYQRLRMIRNIEKAKDSAFEMSFSDPSDPSTVPEVLRYAAENLFAPKVGCNPPPLDGSLQIMETPTRYHEVEEIGRRLKRLLANGSVPHHLALVVPDFATYLPAVEDVGRRFGLSFHYRRGAPLGVQAPILAITDLLGLWGSNWERTRVIRLMESPYFNFSDRVPRRELLEAGVTDDRAGGGFKENLDKLKNKTGIFNDEIKPVLDWVEKLRRAGDILDEADSWPRFMECFNLILDEFGWPNSENIPAGLPDQDLGRVYLERLKVDKLAVSRFKEILSQLGKALSTSPEAPPVGLANFRLWLGKAVDEAYLGNKLKPAGRIQLLNYHELHGTFFKSLFLMGLNERIYPSGRAEGCWWPSKFVDGLAATSLGRPLWTGASDRYQEGEEIVAAALAQAEEVTLSYFTIDDGRRPILPSPLIESLKALWPTDELKTQKPGWPLPPDYDRICDPGEMWLFQVLNHKTDEPPQNLPKLLGQPQELWWSLRARHGFEVLEKLPQGVLKAWILNQASYLDLPLLDLSPLTSYATCPRQFWYGHVLGLGIEGGEVESWSSLQQGNAVHRTFERFLKPLEEGQSKVDLSLKRLKTILHEVCAENAAQEPVGRIPLWEEELRRLTLNVERWHGRQKDLADTKVVHLEWIFGDSKTAKAPPLLIDGKSPFYLKGRIDRIDQDGETFLIRDYKLRYNERYDLPTDDSVPVSHYQMIMYCLAVENHFKKKAIGFLEFLDPVNGPEVIEINKKESDLFANIWNSLITGDLTIPEEPPCEDCQFCSLCRRGL